MARATADRALAHGLLKPELAEPLLGVLAGPADGAPEAPRGDPMSGTARTPHAHLTRTPPRASRNGAAR